MSEMKTVQGILDVIKSITSNRESGRLDISSFGTHGTLLFNEGKLVDARLESLSGFQAVNAVVSLRNVEFSFDHVAPVAHSNTITPAERVVLQRFFGIEAAEMEPTGDVEPNWNTTPEQVVPLTEVEEISHGDVEIPAAVEILPTERADASRVEVGPSAQAGLSEVLCASTVNARNPTINPRNATINARNFFPRRAASVPVAFRLTPAVAVAVCVVLLVGLAVAATALRSKMKARRQATAVASAVESQPSAVPAAQHGATSSVPNPQRELKEVADQSPAIGVSSSNTSAQRNTSTQQNTSTQHNTSTQQNTPARNASSAATVSAQRRETTDAPDADVQDLTGEWRVINTVEKTAYKSFDSMQVGFRLRINQRGKEFTAKGEKFSENGETLPAGSRTPIHVRGSIDGDKVVATFVEEGRMRKTNGRFVWKLQSGGDALAGTFVSTAANSSGRSAVTKQ